MKKLFSLLLAMSILLLFLTNCENVTSPENQATGKNIVLDKSVKAPYHYDLKATDYLSDAYGKILLRKIGDGVKYKEDDTYSFVLNAFNLKPGKEYHLRSWRSPSVPAPIVFPPFTTEELTATAGHVGNLHMRGTIGLSKGKKLQIFSIGSKAIDIVLSTMEFEY